MASCVEKLNVLLDHWAAFEKNKENPDYWERVIKQEYKDDEKDKMDDDDEMDEMDDALSADDADDVADDADDGVNTCIPIENDLRCKDRVSNGLSYNTYCPDNDNCRKKNVCVSEANHCLKKVGGEIVNRFTVKGDNSQKIKGNRLGEFKEFMQIKNL